MVKITKLFKASTLRVIKVDINGVVGDGSDFRTIFCPSLKILKKPLEARGLKQLKFQY